MTRKFVCVVGLVLVAGLVLPACANRGGTLHPASGSNISLAPSDVSFTKIAQGKDCETVIFNMQFDVPSYLEAQQQALQAAGAEHLLDEVSYDGFEGFFIKNPAAALAGVGPAIILKIYGDHCLYVEGHGIKRK